MLGPLKEKLNQKIAPLIEKVKGNPALEKLSVLGKFRIVERLERALGFGKWLVVIFVGLNLTVFLAVIVFFQIHPLASHRPAILSFIRDKLGAQEVSLRDLRWSGSLSHLSIGFVAEDLSIARWGQTEVFFSPELKLHIQPLKFLFGRLPVLVHSENVRWVLTPTGNAERMDQKKTEADLMSPEGVGQHWSEGLPGLLSAIRWTLDLKGAEVEISPRYFGDDSGDSTGRLSGVNVEAVVAGFPETFSVRVESQVELDLFEGRWLGAGPINIDVRGHFLSEAGKPVGLEIEEFDTDLQQLNLKGWNVLEKTKQKLQLRTPLRVLLDDAAKFKSAELVNAYFDYESLRLNLAGLVSANGQNSIRWSLARTEVDKLSLPITRIRDVPLKGVVETSGEFKRSSAGDYSGIWKAELNNIFFAPQAIPGTLAGESSGEIRLSFVTEGSLTDRGWVSPRTELQIDATPAQVAFAGGRFMKPRGELSDFLMRIEVADDTLKIPNFGLKLHTMELKGQVVVNSLAKILEGGAGEASVDIATNRVDLGYWNNFFPIFRKLPLEGFLQVIAHAKIPLRLDGDIHWDQAQWRVDRATVSRLKGAFDPEVAEQLHVPDKYNLRGPFSTDWIVQGRGMGSRVEKASIVANADLSQLSFVVGTGFRKPVGVPLKFELALEQNRNRIGINRGLIQFHTAQLRLNGGVYQGAGRTGIDLVMLRPVQLQDWKEIFPNSGQSPLKGQISWSGNLGLGKIESDQEGVDWNQISLIGTLQGSNIAGRFPILQQPLDQGEFVATFSPHSVSIPRSSWMLAGRKFKLSGVVTPGATAKTQKDRLSVADLLLNQNTERKFALDADQADLSELFLGTVAVQNNEAGAGRDAYREWLNELQSRPGKTEVAFTVNRLYWQGKDLGKIQGRSILDNDVLRVDPVALDGFGGSVTGSFVADYRPWILRKDPPDYSSSIRFKNVRLGRMAELLPPGWTPGLNGVMNSEAVFTAKAAYSSDFVRALRGRIRGDLSETKWPIHDLFRKQMETTLGNQLINLGLQRILDTKVCFSPVEKVQWDVQWIGDQSLEFDTINAGFAQGTTLNGQGSLDKEGRISFQTRWTPGRACLKGDLADCMAQKSILAKFSGAFNQPEMNVDYKGVVDDLAQCAAAGVRDRVQSKLKQELEKKFLQNKSQ